MPPAALPGLRPAAAPPGGRARSRSGAQPAFRRIWPPCGGRHLARRMGLGWRADSADHKPAAIFRQWTARGCPCQSSGVGNRAQQGLRSEVSSERPEGRMPAGSVRRDGTGNPEPTPRDVRATPSRVTEAAARWRRAASWRRGCRRCSRSLRSSRPRTRWPGARRLSARRRARAGRGRAGPAS